MRSISVAERRARLGIRHRLAADVRTDDPLAVARSLTALHATDPASVFLQVAARGRTTGPGHVEKALYDDRTLLRLLAMRRTMFVVPTDFLPALQAAVADPLAVKQRARYTKLMADGGLGGDDVDAWLADVEESTHRALLELGAATGAQLSAAEPRLRSQVLLAPGKSYESMTNITTWVLVTLGCEGRIVRGRPNGTWVSSQYVWSPIETWLPDGVPALPLPEARAEVVRRYLRAFGPATALDVKWWTGWTAGEVKKALADLETAETDAGLVLADDLEPVPAPEPWAALLPALDATPMGWKERDFYLDPAHVPALFDRNGNIGPSVWWDGRIVGGWSQDAGGAVVFRLLEDAGAAAKAAVEAEAERMTAFLGGVRITPRFRTPLERELSA
ncbi:winged helix DNA-binding domain-containing protein [Actinomadura logoneensis]|uniref:Winged helix DNA-binding domain-containing protein n=1 Tax=Actinomadura logoneensis TaxID=2293572 RepID=A0A372J9S7_9ACTN|nr:winged helix DNA-binding domain-containing protein [Actinomadura logoneensis]RFU36747.1 winged helix DNA-binding domain-containing protein [Actinomadura logoneensis]